MMNKLINMLAKPKIAQNKKITKMKHSKTNINDQGSNLIKEVESITSLSHEEDDFICSLCLHFVCPAAITSCGHLFCEYCIGEYLLFFPVC